MARKTKKNTSNRGYATSSLPSKKIPVSVPEQPAITDVSVASSVSHDAPPADLKPNQEPEDHVLTLVKRYELLNDRKAQKNVDEMSQDDRKALEQKPFSLSSELEHEVLQVLKNQGETDTFCKTTE